MGDPPTWKSRRKKQGKLKAEELLTLFSVILPLVLPEMELDNDPNRHQAMLNSFSDLVGATNILASFKTSSSAADTFHSYYYDYFVSIQNLFPDVDILPNHHYTMHNPGILKNWGPLTSQNVFMVTKNAITPDGWFKTGDIVIRHKEGHYYIGAVFACSFHVYLLRPLIQWTGQRSLLSTRYAHRAFCLVTNP
jgi:acyl-CoA synthetase (AMP-forming)/AMP-acid ligase II